MHLVGGILSLASTLFMASIAPAPNPRFPRAVEYSRPGGVPLYFDAAIPPGSGPFPAVVIVHGGGWVRGDRRADVAPLFRPLEDAGIAWFSVDYRLLRNFSEFSAPIEDVRNAVVYIREHASQYRIDPNRIALIGESAGGQLAAMAALNPKPGGQVSGVVAFYAPTNLAALAKNSDLIPSQLRASIVGTPFEALLIAGLRQLSPVDKVTPGAPPFLLIHGTSDGLVPFAQSQAMCARLKAAGTHCELLPIQGGGHGIRWWESALPQEATEYKTEMISWLRQVLNA
ncbi:MAG TPA: alpha/beta hydrolase [Bryobacteraceae bacterium]|nr:alpha/beta hydrolase [Bryobacteraceae bacterium]